MYQKWLFKMERSFKVFVIINLNSKRKGEGKLWWLKKVYLPKWSGFGRIRIRLFYEWGMGVRGFEPWSPRRGRWLWWYANGFYANTIKEQPELFANMALMSCLKCKWEWPAAFSGHKLGAGAGYTHKKCVQYCMASKKNIIVIFEQS